MATASHTEVLKGHAAEVFAAFEDPDVIIAWQSDLLEIEIVKGAFNRKGGVARMLVKQAGIKTEMTAEVVERKAPSMARYRYEGAQAPFEVTNSFRDLGDGRTEWTSELDLKLGFVFKPLGPVLRPIANELVKRNGRNFKGWCEENL